MRTERVFSCRGTGECCTRLIPVAPPREFWEDDKTKSSGYVHKVGKVQSLGGVGLFDWEVGGLRALAREKKARLAKKLVPWHVAFTRKEGGECVAVTWNIHSMACPFLTKKGGLCGIYPARPLVCRRFPLSADESFIAGERSGRYFPVEYSVQCGCSKDLRPAPRRLLAFEDIHSTAFRTFGDAYIGKIRYDLHFLLLGAIARKMRKVGFFAKTTKTKGELARAARRPIRLSYFLEREGIISKSELAATIELAESELPEWISGSRKKFSFEADLA